MASCLSGKDVFSEIFQFLNGLKHVIEGQMGSFLWIPRNFGVPSSGKFLDGGNIDRAIVKIVKQFRHFFCQKLTVVPNAVATKRGRVRIDPCFEEIERRLFCFVNGHALGPYSVNETAAVMVSGVPFIHALNEALSDRNGKIWPLREHIQVAIGDDRSNFNDGFVFKVKPCHLKVHPNHPVVAFAHAGDLRTGGLGSSQRADSVTGLFRVFKRQHDLTRGSEGNHWKVSLVGRGLQRRNDVVDSFLR